MLDRIITSPSQKGNSQKVSEKTFTQFEVYNSPSEKLIAEELKKANQKIQQLERQVEIIPKIQKLLQEERQKTHQLEQALKQEQDTKWQERNLWKRKEIKPAQKAALISIQRQIDHPTQQDEEGYTRICFETTAAHMGMSSSTAKRAIDAIQEQCPDLPMKTKTVEEHTEDGKKIPRLYILPEKNLVQAAATIEIPEENIHKQGGNRYQCQNPICLSHNVMVKRRLVCLDCGHEIDLEPTYPNGKLKNSTGKTSRNNLLLTDMHVSHPSDCELSAKNFDEPVQLDDVVLKPSTPPIAMQVADDPPIIDLIFTRTKAARLLVDIAGDSPVHIGMNRRGENKYRTIKGRLFLEEAVEHLQGKETYGAFCSRSDGKTRSLCWDVDTQEEWEILQIHARALAAVGYLSILEPSPAGRGGHMWIIFDALVSASTARSTIHNLVPELANIKEYWPAPEHGRGNRLRLPGGKYLRPGINQWCQLISVADGEHSTNGDESAQLLLTHQTPTSIIPSPDPEGEKSELHTSQVEAPQVEQIPTRGSDQEQEPIGVAGIDARWEQQYGQTPEGKRLWFAWTDEYLIARYNARTSPEDLVNINRQGKALASWRGEKTASVAIREEQWTDFGASARRADGSPDSGDAFELYIRLSGKTKSRVLGEQGKALVREARQELESAARSAEPIPNWLEEIITPAGRAHYTRILHSNQQPSAQPEPEQNVTNGTTNRPLDAAADPQEAEHEESKQQGGVSGFQDVPATTPVSDSGYFPGEPCAECSCELYRSMAGEPACIRCYPKAGSADLANSLYPRKHKAT